MRFAMIKRDRLSDCGVARLYAPAPSGSGHSHRPWLPSYMQK